MTRKHILIAGGSGLIGSHLTGLLLARGHSVAHLGRSHHTIPDVKSWTWDIDKFTIEEGALNNVDVVIHMAGAGIADKPWTAERKREIIESRTVTTSLLQYALSKTNNQIKTFIAASAIGYYGFDDNVEPYTEKSQAGTDFQAQVVIEWENALRKLEDLPLRVVILRTGVVLSEQGGMLKEIATPVKAWVGTALGSGKQNVSWIHIDDMCAMYIKAIEDESMCGTYNAVAPTTATNKQVTQAVAKALKRPLILPRVPEFALKLFLGEMASLVLCGNRVSASKILEQGFEFKFPELQTAVNDLLRKR